MSLCPYAYLRVSLSGFLTASDKGSLTTSGELFNISALDPLLPPLLIATLCLCVLLTIFYYSLVVAWEVLWASRRSPSPLDPSAEVVLTPAKLKPFPSDQRIDVQLVDGKVILVWNENGKIHIWDAEKGEIVQEMTISFLRCTKLRISGE